MGYIDVLGIALGVGKTKSGKTRIDMYVGGSLLRVITPVELGLKPGEEVGLRLRDVRVFDGGIYASQASLLPGSGEVSGSPEVFEKYFQNEA